MGLSGKCDFEDQCTMLGSPQEILEKYQIFHSTDAIIPLKIETEKDLVAYYPYLVSMNKDKNGGVIRLSSRPYIDTEEEEHISWKLNAVKKYWRKCKRKKVKFDKNEALKKIALTIPRPLDIKLVNRVAELGNKATIEGLHDEVHDRMRKEWFDLMVKSGWDEDTAYRWVYGFNRYFERVLTLDLPKNNDAERCN